MKYPTEFLLLLLSIIRKIFASGFLQPPFFLFSQSCDICRNGEFKLLTLPRKNIQVYNFSVIWPSLRPSVAHWPLPFNWSLLQTQPRAAPTTIIVVVKADGRYPIASRTSCAKPSTRLFGPAPTNTDWTLPPTAVVRADDNTRRSIPSAHRAHLCTPPCIAFYDPTLHIDASRLYWSDVFLKQQGADGRSRKAMIELECLS